MTPEQRAHVWLWIAHLAHIEADAVAYACPRPPGWEDEVLEQLTAADACAAKAEAVAGRAAEELWGAAMERWEAPS